MPVQAAPRRARDHRRAGAAHPAARRGRRRRSASSGPGVTMEQLASAGGVTKPILYRHFGDRDGLIERHRRAVLRRPAHVGHHAAGRRRRPPASCCASTVDSYLGFIERDPTSTASWCSTRRSAAAPPRAMSSLVDRIAHAGGAGRRRAPAAGRARPAARPCRGPTASSGSSTRPATGGSTTSTMSRDDARRLPRRAALARPRRRARPAGAAGA